MEEMRKEIEEQKRCIFIYFSIFDQFLIYNFYSTFNHSFLLTLKRKGDNNLKEVVKKLEELEEKRSRYFVKELNIINQLFLR